MSEAIERLYYVLDAETNGFDAKVEGAQKRLTSFVEYARVHPVGVLATLSAALAATGLEFAKMAGEVDAGMRRIQAVIPGAVGQTDELKEKLRDLSEVSPRTHEELIRVAETIAKLGTTNLDEIAHHVKTLTDIGDALSVQDLTPLAEALDNIHDAFRLTAQEADDAYTRIAAIAQGKVPLEEINTVIGRSGSVLASMGAHAVDVGQAMVAIVDAGVPMRQASQVLITILAQLDQARKLGTNATEQQQKAAELLLHVLGPVNVETKGLAGAIAELGTAVHGSTTELAAMGFNAQEINAILRIQHAAISDARSDAEKLAEAYAKINSGAVLNRESSEALYQILKNQLHNELVDLGNQLLPSVIQGLKNFSHELDLLSGRWFKQQALLDLRAAADDLGGFGKLAAGTKVAGTEMDKLAAAYRTVKTAQEQGRLDAFLKDLPADKVQNLAEGMRQFALSMRDAVTESDVQLYERLAQAAQAAAHAAADEAALAASRRDSERSATLATTRQQTAEAVASDKTAGVLGPPVTAIEQRKKALIDLHAATVAVQKAQADLDAAAASSDNAAFERAKTAHKQALDEQQRFLARVEELTTAAAQETKAADDKAAATRKQRAAEQASALQQLHTALDQVAGTALDKILVTMGELEIAAKKALNPQVAEEFAAGLRKLRDAADLEAAFEGVSNDVDSLSDRVTEAATVFQRGFAKPALDLIPQLQENVRLAGQLRDASKGTPQEQQRVELYKKAVEQLKLILGLVGDANVALGDTNDTTMSWVDQLREAGDLLSSAVQGAQDLAQALGGVDQQTSKILQGVSAIGQNIGRAAAGDPGAILGVGAGVITLAGGLFGEGPEAKATREAMIKLADEVHHLADVFSLTLTGTQIGRASSDVSRLLSGAQSPSIVQSLPVPLQGRTDDARFWAAIAQELGISMTDLDATAKSLGLDLVHTKEGFELFQDALRKNEFLRYADSYAGKIQLLNDKWAAFDITDPIKQWEDLQKAIATKGSSPVLASYFGKTDLSTQAGRDAAAKAEQDFVTGLQNGTINYAQLGNLSPQDVENFIHTFDQMLSDANAAATGDTGPSGTGGYNDVRTITEVTAGRMVGELSTIRIHSQEIAGNTAMIADLLRQTLPGPVAPIAPPPLPGATTPSRGATGAIQITLQVNLMGLDPTSAAATAGQQIGQAALDAISAALEDDYRYRLRAQGDQTL